MNDSTVDKTGFPPIGKSLGAFVGLLLHFFGTVLSLCVPRSRRIFLFAGGDYCAEIAEIADLFAGFASSDGGPAKVFAKSADVKIANSVRGIRAFWVTLRAKQVFVATRLKDANPYVLRGAAVTVVLAGDADIAGLQENCKSRCRMVSGRARLHLRRITQFVVESEHIANDFRRVLRVVPGKVRVISGLRNYGFRDGLNPADLGLAAATLESKFLAESQEKLIPELEQVSGPIPDLFALAVENIYPLAELATTGVYVASYRKDIDAAALTAMILQESPDTMVYWRVDTESARVPHGAKPVLRGSRRATAAQKQANTVVVEGHKTMRVPKGQTAIRLSDSGIYVGKTKLDSVSVVGEFIADERDSVDHGGVIVNSAKHRLGVPLDRRLLFCLAGTRGAGEIHKYATMQKNAWILTDVPVFGVDNQTLIVSYENIWDALLAADETVVTDELNAKNLASCLDNVTLLGVDGKPEKVTGERATAEIRTIVKKILSIQ